LQEWFEFKIPKTKISGDYIFLGSSGWFQYKIGG
jgi:hypothetical protein